MARNRQLVEMIDARASDPGTWVPLIKYLQSSGRMALYGMNFATGSATITPDSDKVLAEIVTLFKNQPDWKLTVEGHTDNVGAKAANQALSQKRAESVVAWLSTHGVERARLAAAGFGDTKPF